MENFDKDVIEELNLISKHFRHNQQLLSFNEILLDNKLTTHILKENAALQKIVDLYDLYLKNSQDINFFIDELKNANQVDGQVIYCEIEKLEKENGLLKEKILLCLSKNKYSIEKVSLEIVFKGDKTSFVEMFVNSIKNCCRLNNFNIETLKIDNSYLLKIEGIGAYEMFKTKIGIHKALIDEKEVEICVYVYKTPNAFNISFDKNDIKVEICKSKGHGGQGVNTTDSAVKITHLKTKISVECQDERSQIQNRQKAMELLKQKVIDYENKQTKKYICDVKKEQVKQMEHNFVCNIYDFSKKIVFDKINNKTFSLEEFFNGKI